MSVVPFLEAVGINVGRHPAVVPYYLVADAEASSHVPSQERIGIFQPCRAPRDAGAGRERGGQSEGAAGWGRSQCITIRKTVLFITHQNDEAVGYICAIPARL